MKGSFSIWDPTACRVCLDLIHSGYKAEGVSQTDQDWFRSEIKKWVRGFKKGAPGVPYLPSLEYRDLLFPKAELTSVFGHHTPKELPTVQLQVQEQLSGLNLDTENMSTVSSVTPGREKELLSGEESSEDSLDDESVLEDSSLPAKGKKVGPHLKVITINAPLTPPVPGPTTPVTLMTTALTPTTVMTTPITTSVPVDFMANMKAFMENVQANQAAMFKSMQEQIDAMKGAPPSRAPLVSELPKCTNKNPWRCAEHMVLNEGVLHIGEGLGSRPIGDLVFFPSIDHYPFCYVRLADESSLRDDTIPKETIIFDHSKAQSIVVKELRTAEFTNTQLSAFGRKQATFLASKDMVFPFASKGLEAVRRAVLDGKPFPSLEECRPVSLALPNDSTDWEDVQHTFTVSKLDKEIAGKQFNERLPRLPDNLLKAELEAKERLSASLSLQSYLEMLIGNYQDTDIFHVLSKMHLGTFCKDLHAFYLARRACREHTLAAATIRHEPKKLIDSNIWGKDLFPQKEVKEVMDRAAQENKSLLQKWGIFKRKFSSGGDGPQPKKSKKTHKQKKAFVPPAAAAVAAVPPTVYTVPQYVTQSPVFNPVYEQASTTFRAVGAQARGRGGKGNQGKGGQSKGRGHKGSRGGRGAGPHKQQ